MNHSNAQVLDSGRIVFSNAKHMYCIPYINEDTIGSDVYDLVNIVGDTVSITPDDNTVNSKDSEFKDEPLFENVVLGKVQFAATCIDFQNAVMKHIFGWNEEETTGIVSMPTSYKDLHMAIILTFGEGIPEVVLPKVKMNSKAVIATLKTGSGEGNLAGTAYAATIAGTKNGTTKTVETSFCFVPSDVDYSVGSPAAPVVVTKAAVVASSTATLKGNVVFSGSLDTGKYGFKYRKGSGAVTTVALDAAPTSGTDFTKDVTTLAAGNYTFFAFVEQDGHEYVGATQSFTIQ